MNRSVQALLIAPDISQLFPDFVDRVVRSLIICFVDMWILASCYWSSSSLHVYRTGLSHKSWWYRAQWANCFDLFILSLWLEMCWGRGCAGIAGALSRVSSRPKIIECGSTAFLGWETFDDLLSGFYYGLAMTNTTLALKTRPLATPPGVNTVSKIGSQHF